MSTPPRPIQPQDREVDGERYTVSIKKVTSLDIRAKLGVEDVTKKRKGIYERGDGRKGGCCWRKGCWRRGKDIKRNQSTDYRSGDSSIHSVACLRGEECEGERRKRFQQLLAGYMAKVSLSYLTKDNLLFQ